MDFSPGPFIASMLIGAIGFGLFLYGKKAERLPQLVTGLTLMVFPYFVPGLVLMIGIAAAALVGLAIAVRQGL